MLLLFQITSLYIISTHLTDAASLRCYHGSIDNSKELPVEQSADFIDTTFINTNCKLIIVVHGYSTEITTLHEDIIAAYMESYNDTYCYCALNWKKEATAYIDNLTSPIKYALGIKILGIDYPAVSLIALKVADKLATALIDMESDGLDLDNVILIGHSEGSALSANTARKITAKTGTKIGQVIGLDPPIQPIEPALDKDCAKFVYVIHTNPTGLGSRGEQGVIDFWINFGCAVQPGCKRNTVPLTLDSLCSHELAMLIMADAVRYPNSLQGSKATNYSEFLKSVGTPGVDNINFIGPNIDASKPGSFFLCTNAASPFGKESDGMDPTKCPAPSSCSTKIYP